jgi:hypothetical protein
MTFMLLQDLGFVRGVPTLCVMDIAGVDSAWEQEKLEARKMLKKGDESHPSHCCLSVGAFILTNLIIQEKQSRILRRHKLSTPIQMPPN